MKQDIKSLNYEHYVEVLNKSARIYWSEYLARVSGNDNVRKVFYNTPNTLRFRRRYLKRLIDNTFKVLRKLNWVVISLEYARQKQLTEKVQET